MLANNSSATRFPYSRMPSPEATRNDKENVFGFPQKKEEVGLFAVNRVEKVLAPFCSLNILLLRRGPSQAPLTHILSIDSHMHTYEKTKGRGRAGRTDTRISFDRPVGRRASPSRVRAGCKFRRMQIIHWEVCKCSEHVRPVFFEPFSAQHAEDDRERARYLHILDISSHCIATIVP